jgi:hypothetical protein
MKQTIVTKPAARVLAGAAALMPVLLSAPSAAAAPGDAAKETQTAAVHAGYAKAANAVGMVQLHLHHALNCLVGPGGKGYDAAPGDPCKGMGNGAVNDVGDAKKKDLLQKAVEAAVSGIAATDVAAAKKNAAEAESLLKQAQ